MYDIYTNEEKERRQRDTIYISVEIQNVMIGRFVDALFEVVNDTCV